MIKEKLNCTRIRDLNSRWWSKKPNVIEWFFLSSNTSIWENEIVSVATVPSMLNDEENLPGNNICDVLLIGKDGFPMYGMYYIFQVLPSTSNPAPVQPPLPLFMVPIPLPLPWICGFFFAFDSPSAVAGLCPCSLPPSSFPWLFSGFSGCVWLALDAGELSTTDLVSGSWT